MKKLCFSFLILSMMACNNSNTSSPPSSTETKVADTMNTTENTSENPTSEKKVIYTCPMHPEVQSDKPGKCPKCGMTLVEKK